MIAFLWNITQYVEVQSHTSQPALGECACAFALPAAASAQAGQGVLEHGCAVLSMAAEMRSGRCYRINLHGEKLEGNSVTLVFIKVI